MKVCKECNGYLAGLNETVSTSLSPCSCKQPVYQEMSGGRVEVTFKQNQKERELIFKIFQLLMEYVSEEMFNPPKD